MSRDPYQTLGVSSDASDQEVRSAYRKLVQRHHPDHNGGSEESERRFEEVQEAYARIRELRKSEQPRASAGPRTQAPPPPPPRFDPDVEARAAALERELRRAQQARERELRRAQQTRERARQAAREAAAQATPSRPTDEELGHVETDDSFSKIIADARTELSDRFSEAREHPVVQRVSSLIDELDELASKLTGK
jgi:curved DNA-binding protein CbpA